MEEDAVGQEEGGPEGDPGYGIRPGEPGALGGTFPDAPKRFPQPIRPFNEMQDSDAELVGRARGGEGRAFEVLVRRHLGAALAVALAILSDRDAAQDVVQDAFVTALERLDELSRDDAFKGWVLRIVRNRALDRQRSNARFPKLDVAVVNPPDGGDSPERETARSELRDRLSAALATLPEREREVLLLHDLEGWKHREIGEKLGMLEGTVRHVLFRARRMMRAELGSMEEV